MSTYHYLKRILTSEKSASTDDLVSQYNDGLYNLLNIHAPLKTRTVSFTYSAPWYTSALRQLKAQGRRLERVYKKAN